MSASSLIVCPACQAKNRVSITARGRPRCGKCQADLPWLADATTSEFDEIIAGSKLPVLVDLWAPWCGPCRVVAPVLEELSRQRAGSLRIVKVNVDDEPAVSQRLGVKGIPTMVLFDKGKERSRQVGALPGSGIREWIGRSLI